MAVVPEKLVRWTMELETFLGFSCLSFGLGGGDFGESFNLLGDGVTGTWMSYVVRRWSAYDSRRLPSMAAVADELV